jgi:hypothetical protein
VAHELPKVPFTEGGGGGGGDPMSSPCEDFDQVFNINDNLCWNNGDKST